jgi:hypothetical protein
LDIPSKEPSSKLPDKPSDLDANDDKFILLKALGCKRFFLSPDGVELPTRWTV